jgi:hypothetical protein
VISFTVTGSTKRLEAFLAKVSKLNVSALLEPYAQEGVAALARATPEETGLAAHSWGYEITSNGGVYSIIWTNSDVEHGFPVVIMLQYGHGTGTGGYVQGRDFINPAIRPIFDRIAASVWRVVTSA